MPAWFWKTRSFQDLAHSRWLIADFHKAVLPLAVEGVYSPASAEACLGSEGAVAGQMRLPLEASMVPRPPLGTTTSCLILPFLKALRKRS
jgi:hypothetical protein